MPPRRQALIEAFMDSARDLSKAIWLRQAACLRHFQLGPAQVRVVHFIRLHQPATAKDIAATFGITASAATQQVDALVRSGYLRRVPDRGDRRRTGLELSQKSHQRLQRFRAEQLVMAKKILAPLSNGELTTLIKIHQKVTAGQV